MRVARSRTTDQVSSSVFNSADRSPSTPAGAPGGQGPNGGSSLASSRHCWFRFTRSATSAPAATTRTCCAYAQPRRARTAPDPPPPVSVLSAVQRKHGTTSRVPIARTISASRSCRWSPIASRHLHRHLALAERDQLLERRQRVAHAAFGAMGDQIRRLALQLTSSDTQMAPRRDTMDSQPRCGGSRTAGNANGWSRAPSADRWWPDEHHVARRLLERLQQRVERRRRSM